MATLQKSNTTRSTVFKTHHPISSNQISVSINPVTNGKIQPGENRQYVKIVRAILSAKMNDARLARSYRWDDTLAGGKRGGTTSGHLPYGGRAPLTC